MVNQPAAVGCVDFERAGDRGNRGKVIDNRKTSRDLPRASEEIKTKDVSKSLSRLIKPDRKPPKPHRMGSVAWKHERRRLDALFAIYVMGWETIKNKYSNRRAFIRPTRNGNWECDMLPYFHDQSGKALEGIDKLRKEGKHIIIEAKKEYYQVSCEKLTVKDNDLNFAMMALCLLVKGLDHKIIQRAWDDQDDWSTRAARKEQKDGTRSARRRQ